MVRINHPPTHIHYAFQNFPDFYFIFWHDFRNQFIQSQLCHKKISIGLSTGNHIIKINLERMNISVMLRFLSQAHGIYAFQFVQVISF